MIRLGLRNPRKKETQAEDAGQPPQTSILFSALAGTSDKYWYKYFGKIQILRSRAGVVSWVLGQVLRLKKKKKETVKTFVDQFALIRGGG